MVKMAKKSRRGAQAPASRIRASAACHVCRLKKVKCSGIAPCDYCANHGISCIFPSDSKPRSSSKSTDEVLDGESIICRESNQSRRDRDILTSNRSTAENRRHENNHGFPLPRGRPRITVDPCRFCKKTFRRVEHLRRHERTHTQEKPFACHCGLSFSRQDLLSRHLRNMHASINQQGDSQAHGLVHTYDEPEKDRGRRPSSSDEVFQAPDEDDDISETRSGNNRDLVEGHSIRQQFLEPSGSNTDIDMEVPHTLVLPPEHLPSGHEAYPEPMAQDRLMFPGTGEFNWWADEGDLNGFLPTQLLDTDYTLSNFDSLQPASFDVHDALSGQRMEGSEISNQYPVVAAPESSSNPAYAFNNGGVHHDNAHFPNAPTTKTSSRDNMPGIGRELSPLKENSGRAPWKITQNVYDRIRAGLENEYDSVLQDFVLPSRHPLSRYIEGYFRGYHDHLPFMHPPTFDPATISIELLLAVSAVGTLYKFEHEKCYDLFYAAKSVTYAKLDRQRKRSSSKVGSGVAEGARSTGSEYSLSMAASTPLGSSDGDIEKPSVETLQALIILISMGSWGDGQLNTDAFEMAGRLAPLVRKLGISQPDEIPDNSTWEYWVQKEQKRRTLFTAYIVFNLHSIAFNVPPMVMNSEIALCLPHTVELWRASNASQWAVARENHDHPETPFRPLLKDILQGKTMNHQPQLSAFGNMVLLHGVLQTIFQERQRSRNLDSCSLGEDTLKSLEASLRSWQRSWENTVESTLDPLSPKGPMAFNSAALLRIAYVRLNADVGPCRSLQSREPHDLARCVASDSLVVLERTAHTDRAVLQCINALGIVVRAGVAFIARTHTQSWGIVHSMSNIECAWILSCWLRSVANQVETDGLASLREDERGLLGMVSSLVAETSFGQGIHLVSEDHVRIRQLAACTVRLWAEAFSGAHVFQMVQVVAEGLLIAADIIGSS